MDEEKNAIIPRAIVNCAFARKSYPCAGKTWKKIVAFVRGGRLGGIENGSLVKRKRWSKTLNGGEVNEDNVNLRACNLVANFFFLFVEKNWIVEDRFEYEDQ